MCAKGYNFGERSSNLVKLEIFWKNVYEKYKQNLKTINGDYDVFSHLILEFDSALQCHKVSSQSDFKLFQSWSKNFVVFARVVEIIMRQQTTRIFLSLDELEMDTIIRERNFTLIFGSKTSIGFLADREGATFTLDSSMLQEIALLPQINMKKKKNNETSWSESKRCLRM